MVSAGDTFFCEDEDDSVGHLQVVLTPPDPDGRFITVSITSRRAKSEAIVCIEVGDHPYIKRPSVMTFAFARIRTTSWYEEGVKDFSIKAREPIDKRFVKRGRSALIESEYTVNEVRQFCAELRFSDDE